ncbi:MAG TPA: hypothetical protein VG269_02015 [Tepidisphaeraceae bacterium]|jgi:hypothetical protein|nr:hypothetical protein [Tepidisphaeraceae bacterium]
MTNLREFSPGSIPLDLLRRYLAATGWHALRRKIDVPRPESTAARVLIEGRTSAKRNFEIYVSDEEDIELIVPSSANSSEYPAQVERIVTAIAMLKDQSEAVVAQSIREIAFDVVRSTIPDAQVMDDAIHLEIARNFVVGIRSVLAAAATTELHPTPYFLRLKKEGVEFADGCRFGHTFRGSFGFVVESPLYGTNQETLPGIAPAPPFERRVMRRLTNGLKALANAVAADSTGPIVDAVQSGFSANVCEQLAVLIEGTSQNALALDFSFSPEWKEGEPVATPSSEHFMVGHSHMEIASAAARELRLQIRSSAETVFGRVTRLASEGDPSDLTDLMGEREVAILWSSEELGDITVRASLTPADYLRAVDAHATGRPVEVSGTLEHRPRRWVLLNPNNVRIPSS